MDNQESGLTKVLIMPRLVHLALFPVTTLPLVGFVTTLTLPVVVIVTASVKSWKIV